MWSVCSHVAHQEIRETITKHFLVLDEAKQADLITQSCREQLRAKDLLCEWRLWVRVWTFALLFNQLAQRYDSVYRAMQTKYRWAENRQHWDERSAVFTSIFKTPLTQLKPHEWRDWIRRYASDHDGGQSYDGA